MKEFYRSGNEVIKFSTLSDPDEWILQEVIDEEKHKLQEKRMGRGLSRAFTGMQAAVMSMVAGMNTAVYKDGNNVFSQLDIKKSMRAAERRLAKIAGGGRAKGNCSKPHQGAQECAKRVRQRAAGTHTPNYVHGMQYAEQRKHW